MKFRWQCPFCGEFATIQDSDYSFSQHKFDIDNALGWRVLTSEFIVCPNSDCNKFQLITSLHEAVKKVGHYGNINVEVGILLEKWTLVPRSKAKPFPSYIPDSIISDYKEACLIAEISPKASATLSRRCLQGIIRDFWDVTKSKLADAILEIKDKCDKLTWDAIVATKNIGNIGAHMEKDINLIIDVDPNEAELLTNLIEILLKEWYIGRHEKQKNLKKITEASKKKEEQKKSG